MFFMNFNKKCFSKKSPVNLLNTKNQPSHKIRVTDAPVTRTKANMLRTLLQMTEIKISGYKETKSGFILRIFLIYIS